MIEQQIVYTAEADTGSLLIGCEPVFSAVLTRIKEFIISDLLQDNPQLPEHYHEDCTIEELFSELTNDQLFALHSKITKEYLGYPGSRSVGVGGVGLEIIKQNRDKTYSIQASTTSEQYQMTFSAGKYYCHPHFVPFGQKYLEDVTQTEILALGLHDFLSVLDQLTHQTLRLLDVQYLYGVTNPVMAHIAVRKLGFKYVRLSLTDKLRELLDKPINQIGFGSDRKAIFIPMKELQEVAPRIEQTLHRLLSRAAMGDEATYIRKLRIKAIIKLIREIDNDTIIRDALG
jgi:hypothetical protein